MWDLSRPNQHVCFVVDACSRTIVGWGVASHMRTSMVLDAVEMARWSRGTRLEGLRCHSDAGSRFTSLRYGERLAEVGVVPLIGTVGDSYDNALAETVNGCDKAELVRGPASSGPWKTVEDLELATLGWVHWHNASRLHGYPDDVSPAEFEQSFYPAQKAATRSWSKSNSPSLHQTQGGSIELELKHAIRFAARLCRNNGEDDPALAAEALDERLKKKLGHRLMPLVDELGHQLKALDQPTVPADVRRLLERISTADRAGETFRYGPGLPNEQDHIDFPALAESLKQACSTLAGASTMLDDYEERQNDRLEVQREFEAKFAADMLEEQQAVEAEYAADLRSKFDTWF